MKKIIASLLIVGACWGGHAITDQQIRDILTRLNAQGALGANLNPGALAVRVGGALQIPKTLQNTRWLAEIGTDVRNGNNIDRFLPDIRAQSAIPDAPAPVAAPRPAAAQMMMPPPPPLPVAAPRPAIAPRPAAAQMMMPPPPPPAPIPTSKPRIAPKIAPKPVAAQMTPPNSPPPAPRAEAAQMIAPPPPPPPAPPIAAQMMAPPHDRADANRAGLLQQIREGITLKEVKSEDKIKKEKPAPMVAALNKVLATKMKPSTYSSDEESSDDDDWEYEE